MAEDRFEFDDREEDLDFLLSASVKLIIDKGDPHAFSDWFVDAVPQLAPNLIPPSVDAETTRSFLHTMARLIWNRTPLPDHQFRPRPLPKPERNQPCYCGSGRKYKHCCARIEGMNDPFAELSFLKYVLDHWPVARFKELPFAHLPQGNSPTSHGPGSMKAARTPRSSCSSRCSTRSNV